MSSRVFIVDIRRGRQQALKLAPSHQSCAAYLPRGEDPLGDPSSGSPDRHPREPCDVAGAKVFALPGHLCFSGRGSVGVEAWSSRRSAHSRAACRAKRRARPASALEAGLASFHGFGRTGAMSARTWESERTLRKWRNRIYFCWRRPPPRMSLIRPAKESGERRTPTGWPAASKKRINGPAALPRSGLSGGTTEMPGSFPVICL
jgi:hypothetical protein